VEKPRKEKRRNWLSSSLWIPVLFIFFLFFLYLFNREPSVQTIKYGELKQILEASKTNPNIRFEQVHVGANDIRGKIVTVDPATDGEGNAPVTRVVEFRTMRLGLERDQELYPLLDSTVASSYQGEEEESPLRILYTFLILTLFVVGMGVIFILVLRWMSGG